MLIIRVATEASSVRRRITDMLRKKGFTPEEIMSVLREIYIIEENQ